MCNSKGVNQYVIEKLLFEWRQEQAASLRGVSHPNWLCQSLVSTAWALRAVPKLYCFQGFYVGRDKSRQSSFGCFTPNWLRQPLSSSAWAFGRAEIVLFSGFLLLKMVIKKN
jgi:hypothetical protein